MVCDYDGRISIPNPRKVAIAGATDTNSATTRTRRTPGPGRAFRVSPGWAKMLRTRSRSDCGADQGQ